jgi:hypothetical protein
MDLSIGLRLSSGPSSVESFTNLCPEIETTWQESKVYYIFFVSLWGAYPSPQSIYNGLKIKSKHFSIPFGELHLASYAPLLGGPNYPKMLGGNPLLSSLFIPVKLFLSF